MCVCVCEGGGGVFGQCIKTTTTTIKQKGLRNRMESYVKWAIPLVRTNCQLTIFVVYDPNCVCIATKDTVNDKYKSIEHDKSLVSIACVSSGFYLHPNAYRLHFVHLSLYVLSTKLYRKWLHIITPTTWNEPASLVNTQLLVSISNLTKYIQGASTQIVEC